LPLSPARSRRKAGEPHERRPTRPLRFPFLDEQRSRPGGGLPALLSRSYARYSNFTVAAAVIDDEGRVHYGVNVENAAYPVGTCAEQTAIGAMITAGGSRRSTRC
jgi:hypothetical protein